MARVQNRIFTGESITSAAMNEGYTESYAESGQLTRRKIWNELLEQRLSDEDLMQAHWKLLEKKEVVVRNNNKTGKIEIIPTGEIDAYAVKNALEMAYKLKNRYDNTIIVKGKFSGLSDTEIAERVARIVSGTLGIIAGAGTKGSGEPS